LQWFDPDSGSGWDEVDEVDEVLDLLISRATIHHSSRHTSSRANQRVDLTFEKGGGIEFN
jgi:hypothetical protein